MRPSRDHAGIARGALRHRGRLGAPGMAVLASPRNHARAWVVSHRVR
jgi:hypothetical protein